MLKSRALFLFFILNTAFLGYSQSLDSSFRIAQLTPSDSNCNFYKKNNWLPKVYIYNATCACLKTPNSAEANIIRFSLKIQLASFPDSLKIRALQKKELLQSGKISRRKYNQFVKNRLTKIIYQNHLIAYSNAGCKGKPYKYWIWKYVTTHSIKTPKLIWFYIKCFGSCSGHIYKW